ncbi:MAG TPA: hypothetical protein VK901_15410 [Nitrospiraceae bacterium]|nr:hypothetical protein [Nitrospiraceae bacterium]
MILITLVGCAAGGSTVCDGTQQREREMKRVDIGKGIHIDAKAGSEAGEPKLCTRGYSPHHKEPCSEGEQSTTLDHNAFPAGETNCLQRMEQAMRDVEPWIVSLERLTFDRRREVMLEWRKIAEDCWGEK